MSRLGRGAVFVGAIFVGTILVGTLTSLAGAQTGQGATADWELTTVIFGHNLGERLKVRIDNGQLSGAVYRGENLTLHGTLRGSDVSFEFKESDGTLDEYTGHFSGDAMSGDYSSTDPHGVKTTGRWSARRTQAPPPAALSYDFVPRDFQREFSSAIEPVLHIFPGDTVHTTSVDAGGTDEHSVVRVLGGNPLTGPFYVQGAMPGDVLAISIKRLRLNRDWAMSDKGFVGRALTPDYRAKIKPDWSDTRWHLDIEKGMASLEKPSDTLKNLAVPVRPMLGCIGVAPGFGSAPIQAQDSGDFGGNMDFNLLGEGATLYLAVNQPGALLYVGDGHALQGDGELNGNALETSMDITFSVQVLREKNIGTPRAENADFVMAIGFAGSLDSAFREATSELASWLQSDYSLSDGDVAAVLGTSIQYNIAEVADRNVGVVAKIPKRTLALLKPAKPTVMK
jgi:acetamidase/formamidase